MITNSVTQLIKINYERLDYIGAVSCIHERIYHEQRKNRPICPTILAARWEAWCGDTKWSRAMMDFAAAGGMVQDWGGMPQSSSAIPLTFDLFLPDGSEFPGKYRLRDIQEATRLAQAMECPT